MVVVGRADEADVVSAGLLMPRRAAALGEPATATEQVLRSLQQLRQMRRDATGMHADAPAAHGQQSAQDDNCSERRSPLRPRLTVCHDSLSPSTPVPCVEASFPARSTAPLYTTIEGVL